MSTEVRWTRGGVFHVFPTEVKLTKGFGSTGNDGTAMVDDGDLNDGGAARPCTHTRVRRGDDGPGQKEGREPPRDVFSAVANLAVGFLASETTRR